MKKKELKVLSLTVPALDSSECKAIMGGDGYAWEIQLSEVVCSPENLEPERPDYDVDNDIHDYDANDDEYDNSHDIDNEDDNSDPHHAPGGISVNDVVNTLPESIQKYYNHLVNEGILKSVTFAELEGKNAQVSIGSGGCSIIIGIDSEIVLEAWMYGGNLTQELFHIFQYELGLMNDFKDHSPLEFQENLCGWLTDRSCGNFLGEESGAFDEWFRSVVHEDHSVDLEDFIEGVSQWYDDFVRNHIGIGEYADDENYEYQDKISEMLWETVFEWYGYSINK